MVRITGVVGRVVEIRHCKDGTRTVGGISILYGRVPKYVNNSHEARKCHIYMLSPRSQIPEAPRVESSHRHINFASVAISGRSNSDLIDPPLFIPNLVAIIVQCHTRKRPKQLSRFILSVVPFLLLQVQRL